MSLQLHRGFIAVSLYLYCLYKHPLSNSIEGRIGS